MKRIALTAMIAAFSITSLQAQDVVATKAEAKNIKEEHSAGFQKSIADLNLTEDQKLKIKSIKDTYQQQIEEVKKAGAPQEKIDAINKECHEQVLSVLTDSQRVELEKRKIAKTSSNKDEVFSRLKAIQESTDLTEEQKKIKSKELLKSLKTDLSQEDYKEISNKLNQDTQKKVTKTSN